MVAWRSLSPLLLVVPGAMLIVLGVLGCNVGAMSRLGYERLIEAPPSAAPAAPHP